MPIPDEESPTSPQKLNQRLIMALQKAVNIYNQHKLNKKNLPIFKSLCKNETITVLRNYAKDAGLPIDIGVSGIIKHLNQSSTDASDQNNDAKQVIESYNNIINTIEIVAENIHNLLEKRKPIKNELTITSALMIMATFAGFLYNCKNFMSNIAPNIKDAFSDRPGNTVTTIAFCLAGGYLSIKHILDFGKNISNHRTNKIIDTDISTAMTTDITVDLCLKFEESATSLRNYAESNMQQKQKTNEIQI